MARRKKGARRRKKRTLITLGRVVSVGAVAMPILNSRRNAIDDFKAGRFVEGFEDMIFNAQSLYGDWALVAPMVTVPVLMGIAEKFVGRKLPRWKIGDYTIGVF